jgi:hypothetical protein
VVHAGVDNAASAGAHAADGLRGAVIKLRAQRGEGLGEQPGDVHLGNAYLLGDL